MTYNTLYYTLTTTLCPLYAFAIFQVASLPWTATSRNAHAAAYSPLAVARVLATSIRATLPDLSTGACF